MEVHILNKIKTFVSRKIRNSHLLAPENPQYIELGTRKGKDLSEIPKIVWIYWDEDILPFSVQTAIDTVYKHFPNYEIRLVRENDLAAYDINIQNLKQKFAVQAISDYIRLSLIKNYGGVWIDASTLFTKNITDIFDFSNGAEFYGFYSDRLTADTSRPIVECYFLAARANSPFISAWLEEYERCLHAVNPWKYYEGLLLDHKFAQNIGNDDTNYLITYIACMKVMYEQNDFKLHLIKAGDMCHFYTYAFQDKKLDLWETFFVQKPPIRLPSMIKITGPW